MTCPCNRGLQSGGFIASKHKSRATIRSKSKSRRSRRAPRNRSLRRPKTPKTI